MVEDNKISQYNEASGQIFRLSNIWDECRYHRNSGNLKAYKTDLENAEDELSSDVDRLDKKIPFDKKEDKYVEKLKQINFYILKFQLLRQPVFFYAKLREKHQLLKIIQDIAGKGTKLRDVDEDDFD